MNRLYAPIAASVGMLVAALAGLDPAAAQNADFYAGKTLRVLVGLEAGGTVDTAARQFAVYLRKHLPGNPNILVQNLPGAGGAVATNYLAEKAAPDGLTILYGPWDPLAQALGDQNLRAHYEQFEFLGGTGDIRILYMRTNAVPGGAKQPRDVMKAGNLTVGALNYTDFSGLAPHLALKVLGVRDKMIIGYRGGADVFLAMQRGEIDVHSTSISTYRSRNASFIKEGKGIGLAYLVPVDAGGHYRRSDIVTDMPAFPDLYKEIHGKMPSGPAWEALNWLTLQIGELTYVGLAPKGTPPAIIAALRRGFEGASNDPDAQKELIARYGVAFSFIEPDRGRAIFHSLSEISPGVVATLRAATTGLDR